MRAADSSRAMLDPSSKAILKAARRWATPPETKRCPITRRRRVAAGAPFSDINLKIAVLGSLVSREVICLGTPLQLAERVLGRSVDLEREGCAPIPEIREYLAAYPLTDIQLGSVETLHLDGGSSIYPYIWYFWDGEDETFDVATFAGIEHCPNITRFVASALVDVSSISDSSSCSDASGQYDWVSRPRPWKRCSTSGIWRK